MGHLTWSRPTTGWRRKGSIWRWGWFLLANWQIQFQTRLWQSYSDRKFMFPGFAKLPNTIHSENTLIDLRLHRFTLPENLLKHAYLHFVSPNKKQENSCKKVGHVIQCAPLWPTSIKISRVYGVSHTDFSSFIWNSTKYTHDLSFDSIKISVDSIFSTKWLSHTNRVECSTPAHVYLLEYYEEFCRCCLRFLPQLLLVAVFPAMRYCTRTLRSTRHTDKTNSFVIKGNRFSWFVLSLH